MSSIDGTLERALGRTPVARFVAPDRLVRLVEFLAVGGVGMIIDLTLTFALLPQYHYLLANSAGWVAAVTFNFAGNWWLTYDRPSGDVPRQYLSYVSLHGATFGVRAATIALLVETAGVSAGVATLIGVGAAAVANFAGTELVFGGAGEVWFSIVDASNHFAHLVYTSRLRKILQYTGLYNPIFTLYTRGLSVAYRAPKRSISAAGAEATVATAKPVETVSVLHTLEKEQDILAQFVDDVQPDDRVLDVGANLGLFATLAAERAQHVTAVEPHPPTAQRCRENLQRNDGCESRVVEAALGAEPGEIGLAVGQDAVGTQRPEVVDSGADYSVDLRRADSLGEYDVVKIDVEGAEHDVLDGMDWDESPRVVFLEAHDRGDALSLAGRMRDLGYAIEQLGEGAAEQTFLRAVKA